MQGVRVALGIVVGTVVACGAFGSSDEGNGNDTGSTGVSLQGVSKATVVNQREIVVAAPDGGRVGDTIWAVVATTETDPVTPPPGFTVVNGDRGYACGPYGSTMNVFVHTIGNAEPPEYKFQFGGIAVASASLVTLGGLVTGSTAVETSAFLRVGQSPFVAPKVVGGAPSYALVSYMIVGEPAVTFEIATGMTRLFEANGTSIQGRDVEANAAVEIAPVKASKAESCGFVHVALLRRR